MFPKLKIPLGRPHFESTEDTAMFPGMAERMNGMCIQSDGEHTEGEPTY
jgi:hypothetical protein